MIEIGRALNMQRRERVYSESGDRIIELVQDANGCYLLKKFIRLYDEEEEKHYVTRELPDPSSRFADRSSAVNEAQRLLKIPA